MRLLRGIYQERDSLGGDWADASQLCFSQLYPTAGSANGRLDAYASRQFPGQRGIKE